MLFDLSFYILLLSSRFMTSHYVIYHVTAFTCPFINQEIKEKGKSNQEK